MPAYRTGLSRKNGGSLRGRPTMELARPLGLLHPEAAPLSALFAYFLSHERK